MRAQVAVPRQVGGIMTPPTPSDLERDAALRMGASEAITDAERNRRLDANLKNIVAAVQADEARASDSGVAGTEKPREMDQAHRERVCRLIYESGSSPGYCGRDFFLSAYNAVLLKDVLWTLNELLTYKQNEVHR